MKISRLACAILIMFMAKVASAYPTFIGYGYASCMSCHFNPYGNGPLNDYGRGVFATAIADRPFWDSGASEESLSQQSGFLGSAKLPTWLRPSFKARDLILASDINRQLVFSNIIMQADANVVVKTEDSRLLASVTVGYQQTAPFSDQKVIISREHYVGYRWDESAWGVYGGLMDVAYGVRVPDHRAFSRAMTGLAENDQVHGLLLHHYNEKYEIGVHAFAGNLIQDPAGVRPKGMSITSEFEAWKHVRLGASTLYSRNNYREREMGAVHVRAAISEGSAVVGEVGLISDGLRQLGGRQTSDYAFTQLLLRFRRGLHGLLTVEALDGDIAKASNDAYRLSPGIQWFPFQRFELRSDLVCQWNLPAAATAANRFSLAWMAQAHVAF